MWCPKCLKSRLVLTTLAYNDGVVYDEAQCECGHKFPIVWRASTRQQYLLSQYPEAAK